MSRESLARVILAHSRLSLEHGHWSLNSRVPPNALVQIDAENRVRPAELTDDQEYDVIA